ncbi:MAG: molecular chaperone IbpA [Candidatus Tokpelaia sp. JSC085]|nr:MAG: molecular chaperone IbpA [Candidatus Tokpelaia sp. JSC085]
MLSVFLEVNDWKLRVTLAVAGFKPDELDVTSEDSQLVIRGQRAGESEHEYLYRGIASRQFQRVFVLSAGMRVVAASLKNGLLSVDIDRPALEKQVRRVVISASNG